MLELLKDEEISNISYAKTMGRYKEVAQAQLDAIKAELNKPFDKPDSEGWWWFRGIIDKKFLIKEPEIFKVLLFSNEFKIDDGYFSLGKYKGKWYKAFVPGVG